MTHDNSDPRLPAELSGPQWTADMADKLQVAMTAYRATLERNPWMPVVDLLPLLFRLKGKPFSLKDHFPQEPMYRILNLPRRQITKAGRQIAKSTNLAATGILRAASIPYFNHLTVTPLFEQVRKFSSNYVKPFLAETPVKSYIIRPGTDNSVLQRTLANGSNLFYNYALNSADRIRGTPADEMDADEMQDFDLDVLPVIESCLDASEYKLQRLSGTPKTFDGPLEVYWQLSSQGIWHIPCQETGCKHINICTVEDGGGHLLKMIDNPITLVCAKCAKPVNSRLGFYVHGRPDRIASFPGYHMPQVIFPMHYARRSAWAKVQETIREKPKFILYNEVLGESLDVGLKLLTLAEIKAAAKEPYCRPGQFVPSDYIKTAGGIDWGGKGKEKAQDKEEFISNTAMGFGGMSPDGRVHIPFLYRTPYESDHYREATIAKEIMGDARVDHIAHDFGGAGDVRESLMIERGVPRKRIVPFTYSVLSPNKPIVYYQAAGQDGVRSSYTLDKARSLLLLCQLIKTGQIILPDYEAQRIKEYLDDFLSIYEETVENPRGRVKLVKRLPRRTDDVVHVVNYIAMTLYHTTGRWPKIAEAYMTLELDEPRWEDGDR